MKSKRNDLGGYGIKRMEAIAARQVMSWNSILMFDKFGFRS